MSGGSGKSGVGGDTLHGFILHGGDVFKTGRRDIPVLLHLVLLLLLLPVWGAAG